jgi:hypothetical protein
MQYKLLIYFLFCNFVLLFSGVSPVALGTRKVFPVRLLDMFVGHVCKDLCRADIAIANHHLNRPKIGSICQEGTGENCGAACAA